MRISKEIQAYEGPVTAVSMAMTNAIYKGFQKAFSKKGVSMGIIDSITISKASESTMEEGI